MVVFTWFHFHQNRKKEQDKTPWWWSHGGDPPVTAHPLLYLTPKLYHKFYKTMNPYHPCALIYNTVTNPRPNQVVNSCKSRTCR
ncbi:hypothetical protein Hanom_Chr11g01043181 [Helianthus anomalus]